MLPKSTRCSAGSRPVSVGKRFAAAHLFCGLILFSLVVPSAAWSQDVEGTISVKGRAMDLRHAHAFEIDSDTEPGYLDVLIVLTSRPITADQARDREELERLSFKEGLAGIRLVLDPDCKPKALATYHPGFTVFLDGAGEHRWQPSAFDERVAGRLSTPGRQESMGQKWEYDVEFSVPIVLDPEATTVP